MPGRPMVLGIEKLSSGGLVCDVGVLFDVTEEATMRLPFFNTMVSAAVRRNGEG